MCDVFEEPAAFPARQALDRERHQLWHLIGRTPHLDWLLLTKRPENLGHLLPWTMRVGTGALVDPGGPWGNVWLGTSVEDQERADERVPALLSVPAAVHFLSCEPLLAPVNLTAFLWPDRGIKCPIGINPWVIAGGESGPKARPCDLAWLCSLRDQCRAAGVPFFLKQLGARPLEPMPNIVADFFESVGEKIEIAREGARTFAYVDLRDPKGADPAEWPEDLRVQEFPR